MTMMLVLLGLAMAPAALNEADQSAAFKAAGFNQKGAIWRTDCDQDALWLKVETGGTGAACHTGRKSCFYRAVPVGAAPGGGLSLRFVDAERQFDPETVYRHAGAAKRTLKSSE